MYSKLQKIELVGERSCDIYFVQCGQYIATVLLFLKYQILQRIIYQSYT